MDRTADTSKGHKNSKGGEKMIKVAVGHKTYRTHSIDRVAKRLYGQKARAVVSKTDDGRMYGLLVTPERNNPEIFRVRETFVEDAA